MDKLAIAYVTCDKYSHVWDEWYSKYLETWDIKLPVYWCGEEQPAIDNDFIQLHHPQVDVEHWTTKLRKQIEQIPEEYIFVWLDDQIPQMNISAEFAFCYLWMLSNGADAMRFMGRESRARYIQSDNYKGNPIYKLRPGPYLVSFSPNIWKKDFLLDVLQYDESPWSAELNGSVRIQRWLKGIYAYHIDGWILNRVVQ